MSEERRLDGERTLRITVDTPDSDAAVVACPPHPQMGGSRTNGILRAVGEALADREVACLRFDYGPWDEGEGERRDVRNVLAHAREAHDPVGLFGYSFGAGVALLAAAEDDPTPAAVSVLAPPANIGPVETTPALDDIDGPVQVVYGERDTTVDWEPVVERARERGDAVTAVAGDHFFVNQQTKIGDRVAEFVTSQFG